MAEVLLLALHPVLVLIDEGPIAIVEMLFCTSLVALVAAGDKPSASPRRLQIVNTKVSLTLCPALRASLGLNMN